MDQQQKSSNRILSFLRKPKTPLIICRNQKEIISYVSPEFQVPDIKFVKNNPSDKMELAQLHQQEIENLENVFAYIKRSLRKPISQGQKKSHSLPNHIQLATSNNEGKKSYFDFRDALQAMKTQIYNDRLKKIEKKKQKLLYKKPKINLEDKQPQDTTLQQINKNLIEYFNSQNEFKKQNHSNPKFSFENILQNSHKDVFYSKTGKSRNVLNTRLQTGQILYNSTINNQSFQFEQQRIKTEQSPQRLSQRLDKSLMNFSFQLEEDYSQKQSLTQKIQQGIQKFDYKQYQLQHKRNNTEHNQKQNSRKAQIPLFKRRKSFRQNHDIEENQKKKDLTKSKEVEYKVIGNEVRFSANLQDFYKMKVSLNENLNNLADSCQKDRPITQKIRQQIYIHEESSNFDLQKARLDLQNKKKSYITVNNLTEQYRRVISRLNQDFNFEDENIAKVLSKFLNCLSNGQIFTQNEFDILLEQLENTPENDWTINETWIQLIGSLLEEFELDYEYLVKHEQIMKKIKKLMRKKSNSFINEGTKVK